MPELSQLDQIIIALRRQTHRVAVAGLQDRFKPSIIYLSSDVLQEVFNSANFYTDANYNPKNRRLTIMGVPVVEVVGVSGHITFHWPFASSRFGIEATGFVIDEAKQLLEKGQQDASTDDGKETN